MSTKKFKTPSKKNKEAQLPRNSYIQIMQIDTQNNKKCPTKEYTEPAVILRNVTGEYNESGWSLAPMSIYSIFQQLFQVYNNKYKGR